MLKTMITFCGLFLLVACTPFLYDFEDSVLKVAGIASIKSQQGSTDEERQLRAMRASKMNAYQELSEQVYGIRIEAKVDVNDQQLVLDETKGTIDGLIRAAQVVASYRVGDSYVTELELDLMKMEDFMKFGESHYVPVDNQIIF